MVGYAPFYVVETYEMLLDAVGTGANQGNEDQNTTFNLQRVEPVADG